MSGIIRIFCQGFFPPEKGIGKILLLAVVFRNRIQQMLQRGIPVFRREIDHLFKIGNSFVVILFNGITAPPTDQAFFIIRIHDQGAGIKPDRIIDPSFDFGNLTQVEIRVVSILMSVGGIGFDNGFKCPDRTDSVWFVETFQSLVEQIRRRPSMFFIHDTPRCKCAS